MTSARTIFFASERGANLGHLGRDLALALAFQRNGDNVILAVPDLRAAHAFLENGNFTVVQAPVLHAAFAANASSVNFADMLLNFGFVDAKALTSAVDDWLALFDSVRPALVVYNNAPTALIAARIAKLPVQIVGSAFEIPPATSILPPFRPELDISTDRLSSTEAAALEQINAQFARRGVQKVQHLRDLYPAAAVSLTTLAELDPFGPREEVAYVGPVFALPRQDDVEWHSDAPRVFVYLRPSVPGCEAMLEALQASKIEVICMMPQCPAGWIARFDCIRFYANPLSLAFLLPSAQLVVTCGVGLVTTALLSGVPVVYLPQTAEQHLVGHAASRTGAVVLIGGRHSPLEMASALTEALDIVSTRVSAVKFATSYLSVKFENNARRIISASNADLWDLQ